MIHEARIITIILMTVCAFALLLWDGHCMANKETGDTVSELLRSANKASGGLIAILSVGLWWHFFGILPGSWK